MTHTTGLHPTKSRQHRFHFLDALRGIVSILVVFLHAPGYVVFRPVQNAQLAVDFFFCLSGFVIAFSYEKRLQNALSLKDFMVARAIRLYPIYLLSITFGMVSFFVFDFHLSLTHTIIARLVALIFLQLVMLPPLRLWFSPSLFPLDFPAWSMFFEVLANLAYAWMLRRRIAGIGMVLTVAMSSLTVLGYWLLHGGTIDVGQMRFASSLLAIFRVAFSFLAGVLVFRLFRQQQTPHWPPLQSAAIALLLAAALVFLLVGPYLAMREQRSTLITIAIVFPCFIYLGARCRLSAFWHPSCTFLGDISYPLYLLHVPVMGLLSLSWISRAMHESPLTQAASITGILCISIAASVLATKYYDVPVRKFLTRRYNSRLPNQPLVVQP
jgi:peptidoglycan/LPS O-acetylase OafA/YrhL